MSENINKNLDILFNISNKKENKGKGTNTLLELTKIIEIALIEKVLLKILIISSTNNKKTFNKDFNIIFSIFKKIYEARDKKYPIHIESFITNYILKFILSLDDKELDFIESLLNENEKEIFRTIYKKYKHIQSKDIFKALSFISTSNLTILNPYIKKNKNIIIPDDNASNLKKLYFILLVFFSSCIEKFIEKPAIIPFLKKILLNYNKNTLSVDPSEEVQFAIVLGCLCNIDFSFFIETIANKIIEEKSINEKNKTNIDTRVKSSKDISDLFEIFLELNISNSKKLSDISFIQSI